MLKMLLALAAIAPLAGCMVTDVISQATNTVKGSGRAKTEDRNVSKFSHIAVQGAMDCDITVGGKQSLSITADDNLLQYITTEVTGDTLIIGFKSNTSTSTQLGFRAKISIPTLNGFDLAGSGDANIKNVKGKSFVVSISGSGDIQATGVADAVSVSIAGSGDVDTKGLQSKSAQVSISGSGNIQVSASERLDANIAGSGDVKYFGSPKVGKSIVGSGDVYAG